MHLRAKRFAVLMCAAVMAVCTGCASMGVRDTEGLDNGKDLAAGREKMLSQSKKKADAPG